MDEVIQDLRFALRILIKKPAFTLMIVGILALGIGANTTIFSLVNGVLLRPLPFRDSGRLVEIQEMHPDNLQTDNLTYATFLDLEGSLKTLDRVSAFRLWFFNLTGSGEPQRVLGSLVSADFFTALGTPPLRGRFLSSQDQVGSGDVVVLSYGLWVRRYGSDPSVIGKNIRLSGYAYTVVGIAPREFDFPGGAQLWTPLLARRVRLAQNRRAHLLMVLARLHPGRSLPQARSELASRALQISEANPGVDPGLALNSVPLLQLIVAPVRAPLLILFAAVGVLLLIACANVANLVLARASARQREAAVRLALGAGRGRLIRQWITESVLLGLLGGIAGTWLTLLGLDAIKSAGFVDIPRLQQASIDWNVLAFTSLVSMLTGILFGLLPGFQMGRLFLIRSLQAAGRGSAGSNGRSLRNVLMVSEVALAFLLLVAAGLLANSFVRLLRVNPGFNPDNVLSMELFVTPASYTEGQSNQALSSFFGDVLERIRQIPGVRSAGLINVLPLRSGPATSIEISGRTHSQGEREPLADVRIVEPGYFRSLEVPLLKGRVFSRSDDAKAPKVLLINEAMARRFWPGEDPVGKKLTMKDWGPPLTGTIVGVVGNTKVDSLDSTDRSMIYWPYPQFPQIFDALVIRTDTKPEALIPAVKQVVWSVNPNQPVTRVRSMNGLISASLARRRFSMMLLAVFAGIALLLAATGVYGIVSYSVSRRTQEIGIRLAMGAQKRDVLNLVRWETFRFVFLGTLIGGAAALASGRLLENQLFGVSSGDPLTFLTVFVVIVMVTLAACTFPARRVAKMDPLDALRVE